MTPAQEESRPRNGRTLTNALLIPRPIQHDGHLHGTWAEASRCLYTSHPSKIAGQKYEEWR